MAFLPAAAAAGAAGTAAAATGATAAIGSGIAAGSALAGGAAASAIPGMVGATLAAPGAAAGLGSLGALGASGAGAAGLGSLAANFAPASYLASSGLAGALPGAAANALPTLAATSPAAGALGNYAGAQFFNPAIHSVPSQAFMNATVAGSGAPIQAMGAQQALGVEALKQGIAANSPAAQLANPLYSATTYPVGAVPGTQLTTTLGAAPSAVPASVSKASQIPGLQTATTAIPGMQTPITASPATAATPQATSTLGGMYDKATQWAKDNPLLANVGSSLAMNQLMKPSTEKPSEKSPGMIRPYEFKSVQRPEAYATMPTPGDTSERLYFDNQFIAGTPYEAPGPEYEKAHGGLTALAVGGPVEQMAAMNAVGANTGYPQANINTPMYTNPMVQRPEATNVLAPTVDAGVGTYTGEPRFAGGGLSDLGSYSDGGRLLRGPGDGVSDSIPAVIGERQPARLADGEFVVPARIVSELGNGSTEAGARKLYAMMDRVQKARRKTVGKERVAVDTKADKHLPV